MTKTTFNLGIDIGGTKIEGSVIDTQGTIHKTIRIQTPKDTPSFLKSLLQLISDLQKDHSIQKIGFSIPGSIDPKTKILRNAPNSPEINGTTFFEDLKQYLDTPFICENDANCLIYGEWKLGAAKGYKNAVGLIMGTGFGSGVILNNALFKSQNGLAPELGHTPLIVGGRPCLCGNSGCVEAYLSGTSILKRYHEKGGSQDIQTTQQVFEITDPVADNIRQETQNLFSRFVANLTSIYDPEIIILAGGLSKQPLYDECQPLIKQAIFGSDLAPPLKLAQFGDASGKVGATLF